LFARGIQSEEARYMNDQCGAKGFKTGAWDPFYRAGDCTKHDAEYEKLLAGLPHDPPWTVTKDFLTHITRTAARGLFAVIAYLPYAIIGGVGGYFRMKYLERKLK